MKHNIKTNEVRGAGFLQARAGERMQMKLQPKFWVHAMLLWRQPCAGLQRRSEEETQSCSPLTTTEGIFLSP